MSWGWPPFYSNEPGIRLPTTVQSCSFRLHWRRPGGSCTLESFGLFTLISRDLAELPSQSPAAIPYSTMLPFERFQPGFKFYLHQRHFATPYEAPRTIPTTNVSYHPPFYELSVRPRSRSVTFAFLAPLRGLSNKAITRFGM